MAAFFANIRQQQVNDTNSNGRQCQYDILHISTNAIGTKIANTRDDKAIRIWKLVALGPTDCVLIPSGHAEPVKRISWLPTSDNRFASVGGDGYLKLWTLAGTLEREIRVSTERTEDKFRLVDYSVDGLYLSLTNEDTLVILDVNDGYKKLYEMQFSDTISEVKWLNDQHTLLVGLVNGCINFLQLKENLEIVYTLSGPRSAVNCMAIDPRGRFICAGNEDGIVFFYNTADLQNSKTITKVDESITSLDIIKDGNYVAVGYEKDCNIHIYECGTLEKIHEIKDPSCKVLKLPLFKWLPTVNGYIYTSNQNRLMNVARKA